jgi:hypothetical protein
MPGRLKTPALLALIFAVALATRLCHVRILWAEESLPMAAAAQIARGAVLYRDLWFDKPPLLAFFYLGQPIWMARVVGALYVVLAAYLVGRFSRELWGEREGRWAAGLLAFFLIFYAASAVVPLASDLLMLAPHVAAVYLAWRGRLLWSGMTAGLAFLVNSKAVFVLAACALWAGRSLPLLLAGFALPNLAAVAWLWAAGAWPAYIDQVWRWGSVYAGGTFVDRPVMNGLMRTANWLGFHGALLVAAAAAIILKPGLKADRRRFLAWALISLAAVAAGWRFFPRYYFQLLPVLVLAASRGLVLLHGRRAAALALLLIPLARFGPRYVLLAGDLIRGEPHEWSDVAMDRDSRAAAAVVRSRARRGDTVFVWGFRPELYVYTRLPAATRFLDSQPLTGVPADRHLKQSEPLVPGLAAENRLLLQQSRPDWVLDGLGSYNPRLALSAYEDLKEWMASYHLETRSGMTFVYRRTD